MPIFVVDSMMNQSPRRFPGTKNTTKMAKIYVWATDKFLSGWGHAEGKIHKQVAVCENWDEADKMIDGFKGDGSYKHVNYSTEKPYFSPKRYTATFRPAKNFVIYMNK